MNKAKAFLKLLTVIFATSILIAELIRNEVISEKQFAIGFLFIYVLAIYFILKTDE